MISGFDAWRVQPEDIEKLAKGFDELADEIERSVMDRIQHLRGQAAYYRLYAENMKKERK